MASRQASRRLLQQLQRGFASAAAPEAAVTADNAFLRFGNPFPQVWNMNSCLAQLPQTQVTRLPNGLRVASETIPYASTATVAVYIDAGSRYESDASAGAAHFLEHMAFKGTTSRTVKQLEQEVEDRGAHLNAYTTREQTCYHAKVFKGDVKWATDVLADILQNSKLDQSGIEHERNIILREMQEIEGMPDEVVFDHLHATAFQRSSLGRTILGPAENIRRMTREDMMNYIATHYTAPRMVISAAGAVDHAELVAAAEKAFGKLPASGVSTDELVKQSPAFFTGSDVRIRDPELEKMHLAIAFKGVSWADPDAIALQVMQTMLGIWNSTSGSGSDAGSKLAQRVAVNGLADSYMAFNTNYKDTGLWGVYATADAHSDHEDLCWAIMHEVTKMCYEVKEEDVARARNQLKASSLYYSDSPFGAAEEVGRSLLVYGRAMPKAELFARIDAVDAATVKAVAQRIILDQDVAVAAMGATQFVPDYNWLRRRTYWLRY